MLVHERVMQMAAARPDAIAVEGSWCAVTYAEIVRRAGAVARRLTTLEVGPEDLVGLCASPAVDNIAAILGVLEAGAAFVPIDPAYPADRVAAMLETCRPRLILAADRLAGWRVLEPWPRMSLSEAVTEVEPDGTPPASPRLERAAYLIFTSGSTGRPKGVLVQHSGLANLVEQQIEAFGIGPASRVLQFASLSFDAAVSEVFTALCAGSTLCLVERPADRQGVGLLDLLERRRISVVTLPPSLLRVLPARELPELCTLVSAGEACSPEVVRRWWRPGRRLINAYGPSEATVCATMKRLSGPDDEPTLGRELRGVDAHVLDDALCATADGLEGELFLGGAGLARCYLGDPARTAERFLPDAISGRPGARLYRTGDRALRRPDGELDFLGRTDEQVKVRGFRIEPDDVAAALRHAPGVRDVLVAAHRRGGELVLVAHVIGDPSAEGVIRAAARRQLPDFLQPSEYQFLDAWPLTPAGKVDRTALRRSGASPPPEASIPGTERGATAAVARLFEELLEIRGVDPERSFFEIGGDSILAIRLLLRIESELGRRLRLGALFEHPSAAALGMLLERETSPGGQAGPRRPVALRSAGDHPPLWLVAPVHGNPVCYLELARRFPAGRPCLGLQVPGLEAGEGEPYVDFATLAREQVAVVRRVQPVGPYLLAGWSLGGSLAFEMALELQRQSQDVPHLILMGATPPSADHIAAAREVMEDYAPWRICYMFGRTMSLAAGEPVTLDLEEFRDLAPEAAYRLFARRLDGVGPVAADTPIAEIERWIRVFRANLYGFHHHAPLATYRGRALVLKPTAVNQFLARDPLVTRRVPPGDWRDHLDGPVDFVPIGGDHFGLMSPPWVQEIVDRMAEWLAKSDRREDRP